MCGVIPLIEGACVEEVHTWRVCLWRRSTHGGCKCGGSPHIDPLKNAVQHRKPPSPTIQTHAMTTLSMDIAEAYMTVFSMKITIPDRPNTRHDQACELHSKMSVSVFGNLDIRRMSISRTVSGPEVAARWCRDALLFCLSNRRIGHSSAYSGIFAPRPLTRSYRPPASSSSAWTKIAMVTHQSEISICGLANVTCSQKKCSWPTPRPLDVASTTS